MSECEHKEFEARVEVNRLEDVKQFAADVHIQCRDCGMPFRFLGLPAGLRPERPAVSVDGTEARLPIAPLDEPILTGDQLARELMPHVFKRSEACQIA